jgi:hypothetical protein
LNGGPAGTGWPIGRGVYRTEIMAMLAALPAVTAVTGLSLQADTSPPTCDNLALCSNDLVRSGAHVIQIAVAGTTTFSRSKERECS